MRRHLAIACCLLTVLFTLPESSAQIYYPPIFYPPVFYPPVFQPPAFHPPIDPVGSPIELGGYLAIGGATKQDPAAHYGNFAGVAGLYGQWNRFGFCPGVDLRIQGNRDDLHGYLVGPRAAYQPRGHLNPFRLYAEALFGKNEIPYNTAVGTGSNTASGSRSGVTRTGVIGLDLHSDSAFSWRVIEFSKGNFTGIPGSYPQTITTGIVLHLP